MGISMKVPPTNLAQIHASLVALSFERMSHEDSHSHALTSTKLCFAALTCRPGSQLFFWCKPCSLLELFTLI
jgi:hypothetical protein